MPRLANLPCQCFIEVIQLSPALVTSYRHDLLLSYTTPLSIEHLFYPHYLVTPFQVSHAVT